jgi:hypothetical protein
VYKLYDSHIFWVVDSLFLPRGTGVIGTGALYPQNVYSQLQAATCSESDSVAQTESENINTAKSGDFAER